MVPVSSHRLVTVVNTEATSSTQTGAVNKGSDGDTR